MNKKLLSLALCVVMLASVLPLEAFAADVATAPAAEAPAPVCTCETACAPAAMNAACPICSAADASETVCAKYVVPAPVAVLSAPGGDEETSPSPTATPEPTPTATPEPTATPDLAEAEAAARVAALQARIDALPTVDEYAAMDEQQHEAFYLTVQELCDAYDQLTEAEQAELDIAALEALLTWDSEQIATLDEGDPVAKIGETTYTSLEAALQNAANGDIKILAKIDSDTFTLSADTTIDLNGNTVSGSFSGTDVKLTITDSSTGKTGVLNFQGGTLKYSESTNEVIAKSQFTVLSGTVNITDGTIKTLNIGEATEGNGTVTVSNGDIEALSHNNGTVKLYGGKYQKLRPNDNSKLSLLAPGYAYFDGDNNIFDIDSNNQKVVTVQPHPSCSYNSTDRCACGRLLTTANYVAQVEKDGTTTAFPATADTDSAKRDALNNAFTYAVTQTGSTVKLLVDFDDTTTIVGTGLTYTIVSGTYTLDLNGKNLDGGVGISNNANLTIKDSSTGTTGTVNKINVTGGTLNIKSGTVKELTYTGGTVSLTGGEYTKVTTSGTTLACIDLCASGYAFYTKDAGGIEATATIVYAGSTTLGGEGTTAYTVNLASGHSCQYNTSELTGRCKDCGRECPHTTLGADNKCTICGVTFVAEVTYTEGGATVTERYQAFNAAVTKAAAKSGTVKLLVDLTESNVEFGSNSFNSYTLDLNGHYFKTQSSTVKGNVTLKDSGATKQSIEGAIKVTSNGSLILDGAKVAKLGADGNATSITVDGGSLTVKQGSTIAGTVTVDNSRDNLTVTGGTFEKEDDNSKVEIKDGANISGGTFNVPFIVTGENTSADLSGGTFAKIQANSADELPKLLATGYVYYDSNGKPIALNNITGTSLTNVTVKECTHNVPDDSTYCTYCGTFFNVKVTYGNPTVTEYFIGEYLADAISAAGDNGRNGTITLLGDINDPFDSLDSTDGKYTLDLNGHSVTVNGLFDVFGDVTLKDSGTTQKMLATGSINVINEEGKLTLDGAVIEIKGTSNKMEVKENGALTVNSGTIKGDVTVTGAKSTLTVTGGTFDKSNDSQGYVNVINGATAKISGGTFNNNTNLQIRNSDVELSGGKFGCISIAPQDTANTLPGILKSGYAYQYYDGNTNGEWTDGSDITDGHIYMVEVKQAPISSVEITVTKDGVEMTENPTYGDPVTLTATAKDKDGKTVGGTKCEWKKIVNVDVGGTEESPISNISAASAADYTPGTDLTGGDNTYCCYVTYNGYKLRSANKVITVKKATLTDEQKAKINAPSKQGGTDGLVYYPEIENGVYTGKGEPRGLFGVSPFPDDSLFYEYSFDGGKTWSGDSRRTDAGTYTALWRVSSTNYETYTPTDNEITNTIAPCPISVKSVTGISDTEKTYDGTPDLPEQSSTPTVNVLYEYFLAGAEMQKNFALKASEYDLKLEYAKESSGVYTPDSNGGNNKPILATVTLKNPNFVFDTDTASTASNKVSTPQVLSITGKINASTTPLVFTAKDITAYIGQAVPSLANPVQGEDYTVTGLVGDDTVKDTGATVNMWYAEKNGNLDQSVTPDMTKPGEYTIVISNTPPNSSNYSSVKHVNGKLTISEKPEYTITATAGLNGSVSPSGAVKVKHGDSQTFVITPNTGYVVANVKVDGVSQGSIRTYTFNNVEEPHTIEATFMRPWGNPQTGVDVG